jgi:hypothetical protein
MNREQFDVVFALGFMITREGFNGECPYEHLSPSRLRPDDHEEYTILEWMKVMEDNREFKRLREEAFLFLKDYENRGTWSDQTPTNPPFTDTASPTEPGRDWHKDFEETETGKQDHRIYLRKCGVEE